MKCAPYLTFNGNCKEAMEFYQSCLGGSLMVQYISDAPNGQSLPKNIGQMVLHAELNYEKLKLYGSDLMESDPHHDGNNMAILLEFDHSMGYAETRRKLLTGGEEIASSETPSGGLQSSVIKDKYHIRWILRLPAAQ